MAKLYDISRWSEQPWWNTGGTRNKKVYQNPEDGKIYYFKQSFNKGKRNYKHEFWSEIVASEIGALLGFDLLPYHIAIRKDTIGCISESMIDPASEELVEGGKYLQAFDSTFDPEDVKQRHQYSFQLILDTIIHFGEEKYLGHIIDTILFDTVIGNSDRHQENWAIIHTHSPTSKSLSEMEKALTEIEGKEDQVLTGLVGWLFKKIYFLKGKIRPQMKQVRLILAKETRFAPIYDSGCSFGRELNDSRVEEMIKSEEAINKYLDKGMAEIHWDGKKINHFHLLQKILEDQEFRTMLLESMDRILRNFNEKKIRYLIESVDNPLKEAGLPFTLPASRKELMIKLLTLRKGRIEDLYDRYRK